MSRRLADKEELRAVACRKLLGLSQWAIDSTPSLLCEQLCKAMCVVVIGHPDYHAKQGNYAEGLRMRPLHVLGNF